MSELSTAEEIVDEHETGDLPAGKAGRRGAEKPADGIGRRLATYRVERGIRVSDLARRVGVSPSLVSQIERGLSRPSVSTLFAIAEALDLSVDAFFRETPPSAGLADRGADPDGRTDAGPADGPDAGLVAGNGAGPDGEPSAARSARGEERYVVRRADRAVIDIESGVRWERLTPGAMKNVEFLELVYGPGAESNPTLYRHPGEEMILILSGQLDIYVGFECYHLHPGDSMHFPSMQPHRYVNPTATTTRAVTTILHDGEWYATPPASNA